MNHPLPTSLAGKRYLRLVRASAWYDLLVTAGFATPWSLAWLHAALSAAGASSGLGALPPLDLMQTLFANLLGSVVVVWALLRLRRPLPAHGGYDAAARALFAAWQAYALACGGPRLLWIFLVFEIAWGVAQALPWLAAGWQARDTAAPARRP